MWTADCAAEGCADQCLVNRYFVRGTSVSNLAFGRLMRPMRCVPDLPRVLPCKECVLTDRASTQAARQRCCQRLRPMWH
jgi:hypothetical protein